MEVNHVYGVTLVFVWVPVVSVAPCPLPSAAAEDQALKPVF